MQRIAIVCVYDALWLSSYKPITLTSKLNVLRALALLSFNKVDKVVILLDNVKTTEQLALKGLIQQNYERWLSKELHSSVFVTCRQVGEPTYVEHIFIMHRTADIQLKILGQYHVWEYLAPQLKHKHEELSQKGIISGSLSFE